MKSTYYLNTIFDCEHYFRNFDCEQRILTKQEHLLIIRHMKETLDHLLHAFVTDALAYAGASASLSGI